MVKILPSILTNNPEEFKEKVTVALAFADMLHIDIMDGEFVSSTSVSIRQVVDILDEMNFQGKIELHLMVNEPVRYIESIEKIRGLSSVCLHMESMQDPKESTSLFRRRNTRIGISSSIIEPFPKLDGVIFDYFVVLSEEEPGYSGTPFSIEAIRQIDYLKQTFKGIEIVVDGGINEITGRNCIVHGASGLIVNSYLFKSNNPKDTYNLLTKLDENE